MFIDCKYNENRDIQPVEQYGFIDLRECLINGEVPSTISDTELEYDDIPLDNVLGKPSDVFEAYAMQDYVKTNGVSKEESA